MSCNSSTAAPAALCNSARPRPGHFAGPPADSRARARSRAIRVSRPAACSICSMSSCGFRWLAELERRVVYGANDLARSCTANRFAKVTLIFNEL